MEYTKMTRRVLIAGAVIVACCLAGCASGGKGTAWEDRSAFIDSELDAFFGAVDRESKTMIIIEAQP